MIFFTQFYRDSIKKIFDEDKRIIDIGGGLRHSHSQGDRYDPAQEWVKPLIAKSDYKILDPVPTYKPDIIGDIHKLPFVDNTIDAYFCLSVLEHVENPILAVQEMHRTLKPGGHAFLFVPFLFYYHAKKGYYPDYWRFSEDAIRLLFKDFSELELESVRGAIETVTNLLPFGSKPPFARIARILDRVFHKDRSMQTSGYYIFATK